MDTYKIIDNLRRCKNLTSTQKLVGCMLAYHYNRKAGAIKIKQSTLATECSLSRKSVSEAIAALVNAGMLERTKTVRTDVLTPCESVEDICGIDQCNLALHCNESQGYIASPNEQHNMPWDCPPTTSKAEENYKRLDRWLKKKEDT